MRSIIDFYRRNPVATFAFVVAGLMAAVIVVRTADGGPLLPVATLLIFGLIIGMIIGFLQRNRGS